MKFRLLAEDVEAAIAGGQHAQVLRSGRLLEPGVLDGKTTDAANPNGSLNNIAGICNRERNVLGMMPHPERAAESLLGSNDGRSIFVSMVDYLNEKVKTRS